LSEATALRVAMAQMKAEWGEPEINMAHAAELIAEGAALGCAIVVLPECMDIGWTHPKAAGLARPIPGEYSETLAEAAWKHGVWVVAGLTEKAGDLIYNTAVLLSPHREIALRHRKINILRIAQPYYAIGDRLGVAHTPLGTIGVDICADNFGNSLVFAHSLARMGARIILSPSAWAVDADHDNEKEPYGKGWRESYKTIATMYGIPVVGVSNVGPIPEGPWAGRKCIGCSLAMGRDGEIAAQGPYGEDAEAVTPVDLEVTPAEVKGTEIAKWLKDRGYRVR